MATKILKSDVTRTKEGYLRVGWGSEEHAAMLGIRPAHEDDEIQHKGFALIDPTAFGPQATKIYLKESLRQQVEVLTGKPPKVLKNAPKMFIPTGGAAQGIV